jgi:hypothetical protein
LATGDRLTVIGEYADTLRALGRYLDQVDAAEVAIRQSPGDFQVRWRGGTGPQTRTRHTHAFTSDELQALRTTARLFRGRDRHRVRFPLSELLRTIGALADDLAAADLRIIETQAGFRLTAHAHGEAVRQTFTYAELIARAHARSHWRVAAAMAPSAEN